MAEITRRMLMHAEHARVLYSKHQARLQKLIRAGARVQSGCDLLFDQAALGSKIPAFTIDLSRFGAKWTAEMKTLLLYPDIRDRKERLQQYRALLDDFYVTASAALKAHIRRMLNRDNWERTQSFAALAARLHVAVWGLRLAALMFWARMPQAADVAERSVNMLQEFLTAMRPVVVPIR